MKHLSIEWRHLDANGETCLRCSGTGKTLAQVVAELAQELGPKGINVTFTETKLTPEKIAQSNSILFNDTALEDLLPGVQVGTSCCSSCSSLIGQDTCCRTVEYQGQIYEEVPENLIRWAALKAVEQL